MKNRGHCCNQARLPHLAKVRGQLLRQQLSLLWVSNLWALSIKYTPDGHRHPVQLEELDARSVQMAGAAASGWRLWICLHFVASGLWLQRPHRPFPFTWGYASPGGCWSYIVLNHMVPRTLMTSLETNVYFHFPLQINKHMNRIYKTWYSENFVVPSYITLPLIFINNWPTCFLKIYHSSLLEGIILSGQPTPGRLQVSIKISVCFFSSPIMIPFLLSHTFGFLN